jgi:hypothetical protein
MTADLAPLDALIAQLETMLADPVTPTSMRTLAQIKVGQLRKLREYVIEGDDAEAAEQVERIAAGRPLWAHVSILAALAAVVVVDETTNPESVTVHWEAVPRDLRPAAASLASELVDAYQDTRPRGGRPRKDQAQKLVH